MARIARVIGKLEATGPAERASNPLNLALYSYLRIVGDDGDELFLEQVFVPAYLDSTLSLGTPTELYVVTIPYPKLFGSHDKSFVYGMTLNGTRRNALKEVRQIFQGTKGAAFHLFWYGLVLMPAFGFGLLFWIAALRLLQLTLPEHQMSESLK